MANLILPERNESDFFDWMGSGADVSSSVTGEESETDRANRLLLHEIEYMGSPDFCDADKREQFLAPTPQNSEEELIAAPAGTPPFLAELYSIALLTHEQEQHLFRKMNFLKFQAERQRTKIDPDHPRVGLLDQIEASVGEALSIRNEIVQANLRLVVSIAKNLIDDANSLEDLISEGIAPLIRAVEIFDFERGTRFSTYATWAVRNSLHRAHPRNRKHRKRYQTSREGVFESLDDHRNVKRGREKYHLQLEDLLEKLLPALDEREQYIVNARFGLTEDETPLRYREIAEELKISTERVRQLFVRSLDRMREYAEQESLELPETLV